MEILFLDQFSEMGGGQHCLLEIVSAVRDAGWTAHAAVAGEGPLTGLLEQRCASVHPLSLGRYPLGRKGLRDAVHFLLDVRRVAPEIRSLAERLRPDLLYVNGPRLMPAVAWAVTGRPVLFHNHNPLARWNERWLTARAIAACGARVVTASRFLADQWAGPSCVIHGGVAGPSRGFVRKAASGGPRIGLIARFGPEKGQKEFVEAAAALLGEWQDAEFVLCGDALFGDRRAERYRDQVLANATSNVRYLGWREDVYEVLGALDLLVHPSHAEGGAPNVILQAFAAGVPVLAAAVGAVPEVISDGWNGFLLPSPTPAAIEEKLRELIPQRSLLAAVSRRARLRWQPDFTAQRYRAKILHTISAVANGYLPWKSRGAKSARFWRQNGQTWPMSGTSM